MEFDLDLPRRVVLGVNNPIVHVERRDVVYEIGLHEPLEAIRQRDVQRRFHRLATFPRAEPVIIAQQKARRHLPRRVQNWKTISSLHKLLKSVNCYVRREMEMAVREIFLHARRGDEMTRIFFRVNSFRLMSSWMPGLVLHKRFVLSRRIKVYPAIDVWDNLR